MSFYLPARSVRAVLLILSTAVMCDPVNAQTLLGSANGVIVLRNGQTLEGDITRAGDYYIVTKGDSFEVRPKVDDVELLCGSLDEAYEFKARHISGISAKGHLELAKWCLRQNLFERCAEQLEAAARVEPDHHELKDLQTRLALAIEKPPETTRPRSAPTVAADDLERALRDLPRGSVEKFSSAVQSILLNKCGAKKCHGPNTDSEFRLLKPAPGQIVSRRYTQRNLYAALKQLDASNPDASPLIALPQQRHGSSLTAIFDKNSANQLAELASWARMTVGAASVSTTVAAPHPATISPTETTLSQPASTNIRMSSATTGGSGPHDSAQSPLATAPGTRGPKAMAEQAASSGNDAILRPPAFRDRYDPEIFNRRYHGK